MLQEVIHYISVTSIFYLIFNTFYEKSVILFLVYGM